VPIKFQHKSRRHPNDLLHLLLSRWENPGLPERREAEEVVRAQLLEFPPEDNQTPERPEPPEDLNFPGSGQGRRPGEWKTLMSKVRTTLSNREAEQVLANPVKHGPPQESPKLPGSLDDLSSADGDSSDDWFPLSEDDLHGVNDIATLFRSRLSFSLMTPAQLRSVAALLLALER
jgi:hypothetical protein